MAIFRTLYYTDVTVGVVALTSYVVAVITAPATSDPLPITSNPVAVMPTFLLNGRRESFLGFVMFELRVVPGWGKSK